MSVCGRFAALCYDKGYFFDGEELELAYKMVDTDGGGKIEYEEFQAWWSKDERFSHLKMDEEQQLVLSKVVEVFQGEDKDKTGNLNEEQFKNVHAKFIELGFVIPEYTAVMSEVDKGGDGSINFNELLAWMSESKCFDKDAESFKKVKLVIEA